AVIELSTRSGANQFHGSAFEFLRNTVLNANNFFTNAARRDRPPFKLNQYGGTIGGPFKKDKIFFFFAYQGTKQRSSPSSVTIQSLTAAQRDGDFSGVPTPIIDPLTGKQFETNGVKNVIPANRVDPVARAVLDAYLPLPNTGNNLLVFQNRNVDDDQYTGRVDYQISEKNRLSGRYYDDENFFQRAFTAPTVFSAGNISRNRSFPARDTHFFSSPFTMPFAGAWSKFRRVQEPQAPGLKPLKSFGVKPPQSIP